jgi:ATP-binding protein involved in chromosome partitioning
MGQVRSITAAADRIAVTVGLTSHSAILWNPTRARIEEALRTAFPQVPTVEVTIEPHDRPPGKLGQIGLEAKSVIAVGSGKGGVGKSTIAASLAIGLARAGSRVGLLDADVYGPSVPHLLGLSGRPQIDAGKIVPMLLPVGPHPMPVMSMGFLVPAGEAVVWRGPMLHGAITQMLRDTAWGPLDYLIIDMPPGTGDIALTLSQVLPLTGAVVVCTPQDVALLDAMKAIAMFRKVNIPLLGMVENMSFFVCPDTQKRYDIFGTGGAKRTAKEFDIPFLGEVPIQIPIREHGDAGRTAANYDDPASRPYLEAICERLVGNLAAAHASRPPMPSLPVL